jgi:hypothetical protein
MIRTGPRGPGALEMFPGVAANLLLAVLYDGELTDAHETVMRLRNAKLVRKQVRRWEQTEVDHDTVPRNGWLAADGQPFNLGEVIEIMLDGWVRYGHLYEVGEDGEEDIDLEPVNIRLEISCPGYRATITFNTPCSLFWRLEYEWKSSEQLQYEDANRGERFATRWDARNGPHIWSSRTVGEDCLHRIGECLRGCDWNDDWHEFTPAYDEPAATVEVETA